MKITNQLEMSPATTFNVLSRESCTPVALDAEGESGKFYWAVAGVILLIALNLLRSWQTLKVPGLYMEDSLLFSYYYGHSRELPAVFSSHVGQNYLTVPADFFAWLFSRLDVRVQPYVYQWWGFCAGVAAASCIFFSGLIRSRIVLLIGPSVLGLSGLNHIYYYNTLIYTMYTGVLVLFCLLLYPAPRTRYGTLFMSILFIVLPWSGPYSVLMLPAGFLHILLYHNRRKNILVFISICSTLLYFSTVASQTTKLSQLQYWVVKRYFQVVVEKIFFLHLLDHVALYWGVVILVMTLLSWYFFRRDTCYPRNTLIIFLLILGSLALFFLSVKFPQFLFTSDCHRVVAVFFWLLFLLYVFDRIYLFYNPNFLIVGTLVLVFVGVVAADNIKYPKRGWVQPIVGVPEFVGAIDFYEKEGLVDKNKYILLHLPSHQRVMQPEVRIGSSHQDAQPLRVDELLDPAWKKFYQVEKKEKAGDEKNAQCNN